jgi:hypothetical protein
MIKVYSCQKMTGRFQDELVQETETLVRALTNHGLECLNPVIEEKVPRVHELLYNLPQDVLESRWRRDKEMIRECDVLLDYQTENTSDGANQEIGYARWCLWKPVVRVWRGPGGLISRIEDDVVVPTLLDAIEVINNRWGTYEKLAVWRRAMLQKSLNKWIDYQESMDKRYRTATCLSLI